MTREIPLEFVLGHHTLDWHAIDLGVREGWLRPWDAVVFAERRVADGVASELETEVAMLTEDDLSASALPSG